MYVMLLAKAVRLLLAPSMHLMCWHLVIVVASCTIFDTYADNHNFYLTALAPQ